MISHRPLSKPRDLLMHYRAAFRRVTITNYVTLRHASRGAAPRLRRVRHYAIFSVRGYSCLALYASYKCAINGGVRKSPHRASTPDKFSRDFSIIACSNLPYRAIAALDSPRSVLRFSKSTLTRNARDFTNYRDKMHFSRISLEGISLCICVCNWY